MHSNVARAGFVAGVVGFFFTFFRVSVESLPFFEVTGFDLAFGGQPNFNDASLNELFAGLQSDRNVFALLALAVGVISLLAALSSARRPQVVTLLGALGTILLLLVFVTERDLGEFGESFGVGLGLGWVVSVAGFIAAAAAGFMGERSRLE